MKRVLWGILWLAGFVAFGCGLFLLLTSLAPHHASPLQRQLFLLGSELGANLFVLGLCFGILPGVRHPSAAPKPLGLWQAGAAIIGFGATMIAGGIALYNLSFLAQLCLLILHAPGALNLTASGLPVATALVGEVTAALWIVWYLRQFGHERLIDGNATGIAWRPAAPGGYRMAVAMAVAIILIVAILYHFIPPDLKLLKSLPAEQLFDGPAWTMMPVLLLAAFLAPALEEILFRGIAFAGIASRFGAAWAAAATTLIFIAVHAPEKIHYLPGFIDVGLMAIGAAWLRLRFHSIRPAMVLHILYNGGLILAAGLFK